jgi:SAM-dependent methyltransferase
LRFGAGGRDGERTELTEFKDLFSRGAGAYAAHRPGYPPRLFAELAALAPRTDIAWDCATGNGQAAIGLAAHFRRVVATDASAGQLAAAVPHAGVTYRLALAEESGLETASIDLVTVAQALHWLDRRRFFAEARRVLIAGGVIAAWAYTLPEIDDRIDPIIRRFSEDVVGTYWRPERRLVETGYRTIEFPFEEIAMPAMWIEQDLSLDQLGAYVRTWSATQRYVEERGADPVAPFLDEIEPLWGDRTSVRRTRRPIAMRVGRKL